MANETVICTYRVRADAEDDFRALLARHWDTLHGLGFVTDDRSLVFRKLDEPTYVEVFTWVEGGVDQAHEDGLGIALCLAAGRGIQSTEEDSPGEGAAGDVPPGIPRRRCRP